MAVQLLCSQLERRRRRKKLLKAGTLLSLYESSMQKRVGRLWTRNWLLRREQLGAFGTLLSELREEDRGSYLNFFRITPNLFDDLLEQVAPIIQHQDTNFRKSVSPSIRLAVTLRYLATGETFKSLGYLFRRGDNTIGKIVPETCLAIHDVLQRNYYTCPTNPEDWEEVAAQYLSKWQFPNCFGSLDGKHVQIRQPRKSGAKYYNYKHRFSIILLALVDAEYKFIWCDIGAQGRCSDAGVYSDCDLHKALERNMIGIPEDRPLRGSDDPFPFCMVADIAFPLKNFIMKPYPQRNLSVEQRIFNYRLSRARRCVENAFGILANRFRVLLNPICLSPEKIDVIVLASCCLNNLLRTLAPNKYTVAPDVTATAHRAFTLDGGSVAGRRSATQSAKQYRDYLCQYFSSEEGRVP